jgi:hypothetical protein
VKEEQTALLQKAQDSLAAEKFLFAEEFVRETQAFFQH